MNLCFSLAQAGGASVMVWIMSGRRSYDVLFWISDIALAISVLCIVAIALLRQRAGAQPATSPVAA